MEQIFIKGDLITLAELRTKLTEDPNYGVYIINSARISHDPQEYADVDVESPIAEGTIDAAININIGSAKEPHLINIPPTWIPVSLADFGEPLEIFKSLGFKGMVERGYVTLISKEAYERIMQDEGAQETRQHLLSEKFKSSIAQTDEQLLKQLNRNAYKKPIASKDGTAKETSKKNTRASTLSNAAYELTDKSADVNHNSLFQKYKALEPKLSKLDLEHIAKHTIVPKMKLAAEKKLALQKD